MEPTRTGLRAGQWLGVVLGLVVTVVLAQALQALLFVTLFSGLPGSPEAADLGTFLFAPGGLLTIALAVLVGTAFIGPLRRWWVLLGGLAMTLMVYVVLGVWTVSGDGGSVGDHLAGIGMLLFFGARLGPLWIVLLVCSLGLWVIRRQIRPGPVPPQDPYSSTII